MEELKGHPGVTSPRLDLASFRSIADAERKKRQSVDSITAEASSIGLAATGEERVVQLAAAKARANEVIASMPNILMNASLAGELSAEIMDLLPEESEGLTASNTKALENWEQNRRLPLRGAAKIVDDYLASNDGLGTAYYDDEKQAWVLSVDWSGGPEI